MKSKEEIKKWILNNCIDENGDIDLSGLDFSDFDGDIYISNIKVKGDLWQDGQEVSGDLWQDGQEVSGDLWQDNQEVKGNLRQGDQEVKGDLWQDGQEVKGKIYLQKKDELEIVEEEKHFDIYRQLKRYSFDNLTKNEILKELGVYDDN